MWEGYGSGTNFKSLVSSKLFTLGIVTAALFCSLGINNFKCPDVLKNKTESMFMTVQFKGDC